VELAERSFGDDVDAGASAGADAVTSPVRSTAVAVFCFLGCLCGYFALLFVPLDDDPVDDFEIKARGAAPRRVPLVAGLLACWLAALTGALPGQAAAHLAALVLALGLESFLRVQHRRQQQAGYLAFYWRTRGLLSIPTRAAALAQARSSPFRAALPASSTWHRRAPGRGRAR
jgi:hypothetical protein